MAPKAQKGSGKQKRKRNNSPGSSPIAKATKTDQHDTDDEAEAKSKKGKKASAGKKKQEPKKLEDKEPHELSGPEHEERNYKELRRLDESRFPDQAEEIVKANPNELATEQDWLRKIAMHLACEPSFIDIIRTQQSLDHIQLSRAWKSAIYLPKIGLHFASYKKVALFLGSRGHNEQIVELAIQLIEDCNELSADEKKMGKMSVSVPDKKDKKNREDLFKLHSTRHILRNVINGCNELQTRLGSTIPDAMAEDPNSDMGDKAQSIILELRQLQEAKLSTREILKESELIDAGYKLLDRLLLSVAPHKPLYDLKDEEGIDPVDDDKPATPEKTAARVQQALKDNHGFEADFVLGRSFNDGWSPVFQTRTPDVQGKATAKVRMKDTLGRLPDMDLKEMRQAEADCAKWLSRLAENIDEKDFKLFYETLIAIETRPEACVNAEKGHHFWTGHKHRMEVMFDNLFHVRKFVSLAVQRGFVANNQKAKLNFTLRRMFALVAVQFGLIREPALLLSVMDRLLENVAEILIGYADTTLETFSHDKVSTLLHNLSVEQKEQLALSADADSRIQELSTNYLARTAFAELARFYRGAISMAVGCVAQRRNASINDEVKAWFEGIIKYTTRCGHATCRDEMTVRVRKNAKSQKWGASVGVKDRRFGFMDERLEISKNRVFAYPCFYNFIRTVRYHDGLGIFYHYYCHLFHHECKVFEGKRMFADWAELQRIVQSQASTQPTQ